MTGSAFIIHNETWSCSNEVVFGKYSTPIFGEDKKVKALKEETTIKVFGIFHQNEILPKVGDKCEIVMLNEDNSEKYGFIGNFKAIGETHTILNIFTKTERINEILHNITFKN